MSKAVHSVWEPYNLFDPKTIQKSVTTTRVEKLKLLFVKSHYSVDQDTNMCTFTKYKIMNGKAYILHVKHCPKGEDK